MIKRTLRALRHSFSGEVGVIPFAELQRRHVRPDAGFLQVQGLNLHYRDINNTGNPDAKVLILLHGVFASLHTWDGWSEKLSQDFRVISLDTPNFGLTGRHPEGMRRYLYSDFILALMQELRIDKAHLAGNSLGGWMTWEFAARFPDKVEKIILLDSAGFFFIPPAVLIGMALPLGGWLASRTFMPRKVLYAIVRTTYGDKSRLDQTTLDRYYDLLMRAGNRQAAAEVLRYIRNKGGFNKSLMRQVRCPTLVMWGRQDAWIPPEHAALFKQRIPHAEVIMYDNCGHMPMEEIPEQSAADALSFLTATA